jgi:hypothetical protein
MLSTASQKKLRWKVRNRPYPPRVSALVRRAVLRRMREEVLRGRRVEARAGGAERRDSAEDEAEGGVPDRKKRKEKKIIGSDRIRFRLERGGFVWPWLGGYRCCRMGRCFGGVFFFFFSSFWL